MSWEEATKKSRSLAALAFFKQSYCVHSLTASPTCKLVTRKTLQQTTGRKVRGSLHSYYARLLRIYILLLLLLYFCVICCCSTCTRRPFLYRTEYGYTGTILSFIDKQHTHDSHRVYQSPFSTVNACRCLCMWEQTMCFCEYTTHAITMPECRLGFHPSTFPLVASICTFRLLMRKKKIYVCMKYEYGKLRKTQQYAQQQSCSERTLLLSGVVM